MNRFVIPLRLRSLAGGDVGRKVTWLELFFDLIFVAAVSQVAGPLHEQYSMEGLVRFGPAVANFFRKPYGPGWALVGDVGYNKDPITAQGITDAFRDAELCTIAYDQVLTGARSFDDAMGEYQRHRDQQVLPMYEFTCQLAMMEPPPPDMQQLFAAIHGNQQAMDGFAQVNAGTISPAAFFSPDNLSRIMTARRTAGA